MMRRGVPSTLLAVVVVVLAATATPAVAAPASAAGPQVTGISLSGPAVVDANESTETYLWANENKTVTVTLTSPNATADANYSVCLGGGNATDESADGSNASTPSEICTDPSLASNESIVTFPSTGGLFNGTGEQVVVATVENESAVLDRQNVSVVVVTKGGDLDEDGLANEAELEHGTNLSVPDTDGDTLKDGPEVQKYGTDPLAVDTDDDGARDGREVTVGTDPTVADTDTDGLEDGYELEKGYNPLDADSDDDGLSDAYEETVGTDPTAADTDSDGLADARELRLGTDPTAADSDDDGLNDAREVELGTDPTASDTDGDFLSDGQEARFGTNPEDSLSPFGYALLVLGLVTVVALQVSGRFEDVTPVDAVRERLAQEDDDATAQADDPGSFGPPESTGETRLPDPPGDRDDGNPPAMTDEERVRELLAANGGRIQQTTVIEETDWSKSKVSRLLSRMADDGEIEKISVGRENLIALSDHASEDSPSTKP